MSWYNFIYSEKKSQRLQRHLVFWLLWWIYFTASNYHYEQSGLEKVEFEPWNLPFFIKSILLLSVHIIACYYFINYLMPKYLFRAKYLPLVIQIIALSFSILISVYFLYKTVFPLVNNAFNYKPFLANQTIWWTSIASGLLSAPKIICAAAATKLLKRWWLKQKEKERLEKEKLLTELQLLKAQMHPEFLFSSLENINQMVEKKNNGIASMLLLKLADILSYILYECDNKFVLLEKEIKTIKDYLVLQKSRKGNKLEIDVAVKGQPGSEMIVPLLLFSFVENSFSYFGNKKSERNWINLEFQIEPNEITMKLIHGKAADAIVLNENATARAKKRLDFYYPGRYELKTTVEPEIMMTYLQIVPEESVNENASRAAGGEKNIYTTEQITYAAV